MFRGASVLKLSKGNNFRFPFKYQNELSQSSNINNHSNRKIMIVPNSNYLALIPNETFSSLPLGDFINDTTWNNDISKILATSLPQMATSWFTENRKILNASQAEKILNKEISHLKGTKSQKGRQIELILKDILLGMGVIVESNVHILGNEIDLLLCKIDTKGSIHYTIIEIKYREKKVTISQVMRLFGLQEVLKKNVNISNAMIANVSGFTQPAEAMIQRLDLTGMGISELFEWVDYNNLNQGKDALAFIKTKRLSKDHRLTIPQELKVHFSNEVILVGQINKFELWDQSEWQKEIESSKRVQANQNQMHEFIKGLSL